MGVEAKRIIKDTVGISGFQEGHDIGIPAAVAFDLFQVVAPNTYNVMWRIAAARGYHTVPFEKRSLIGIVPDLAMLVGGLGVATLGGSPDMAIGAKVVYNAAVSAAPGAIGVVSSIFPRSRHQS